MSFELFVECAGTGSVVPVDGLWESEREAILALQAEFNRLERCVEVNDEASEWGWNVDWGEKEMCWGVGSPGRAIRRVVGTGDITRVDAAARFLSEAVNASENVVCSGIPAPSLPPA